MKLSQAELAVIIAASFLMGMLATVFAMWLGNFLADRREKHTKEVYDPTIDYLTENTTYARFFNDPATTRRALFEPDESYTRAVITGSEKEQKEKMN